MFVPAVMQRVSNKTARGLNANATNSFWKAALRALPVPGPIPGPAVLTEPWRRSGRPEAAPGPSRSSWRRRRLRAGPRSRYSRRRRAGRREPERSWRPPAPRTAGSRAGTSPRGAAAPRGRHVCAVFQCLHFQKASLPTGMAWPRPASPPARPGPGRAPRSAPLRALLRAAPLLPRRGAQRMAGSPRRCGARCSRGGARPGPWAPLPALTAPAPLRSVLRSARAAARRLPLRLPPGGNPAPLQPLRPPPRQPPPGPGTAPDPGCGEAAGAGSARHRSVRGERRQPGWGARGRAPLRGRCSFTVSDLVRAARLASAARQRFRQVRKTRTSQGCFVMLCGGQRTPRAARPLRTVALARGVAQAGPGPLRFALKAPPCEGWSQVIVAKISPCTKGAEFRPHKGSPQNQAQPYL